MALENATTINQLNPLFPAAVDSLAQADDHLRLIKSTIQNTFPNVTGAITATQSEVNQLSGLTTNTSELNKLDGFTGNVTDLNYAKSLASTGVTATEYDYLDGVTSNIQTQLNSKQPTITGAATTIDGANLTANRALVSDGSGKVAASSTITSTELGHLNGVTTNIQSSISNLNNLVSTLNSTVSGIDTDLVNDTSPQLGGDLDCNDHDLILSDGSAQFKFDVSLIGSTAYLFLRYNGNVVFRWDSNGNFISEGDITAFSGI